MSDMKRMAMVLVVAGMIGAAAFAEDVVITGAGSGGKLPIDISELNVPMSSSGGLFRKVLADDLVNSGYFTVTKGSPLVVTGDAGLDASAAAVSFSVTHRGINKNYVSRRISEKPDQVRRLAHRVADMIVEAVKQVKGMAAARVAAVGKTDGGKDLFILDIDGGAVTRVTQNRAPCLGPAWWPDGRKLLYTSLHRGFPDIYMVDLGSNRRTALASYPGMNAGGDVSSDGQRVAMALSKDGNPEIYVMHLGGNRLVRLTQTPKVTESSPSWSPDGREIVFVANRGGLPQLYVMGAEGGEPRQITFRGSENVAPDWGANGSIVYSSRQGGQYIICVYDPAANSSKPVPTDGADYEDPSWAPDGRHIVCSRTERYQSSLYILDTQGDAPRKLTTPKGDWYSPACSVE